MELPRPFPELDNLVVKYYPEIGSYPFSSIPTIVEVIDEASFEKTRQQERQLRFSENRMPNPDAYPWPEQEEALISSTNRSPDT
eukprot:2502626-Amphidinium_carterae.1